LSKSVDVPNVKQPWQDVQKKAEELGTQLNQEDQRTLVIVADLVNYIIECNLAVYKDKDFKETRDGVTKPKTSSHVF
jgi:hypothetical protein